jgi:hypothetical protein
MPAGEGMTMQPFLPADASKFHLYRLLAALSQLGEQHER